MSAHSNYEKVVLDRTLKAMHNALEGTAPYTGIHLTSDVHNGPVTFDLQVNAEDDGDAKLLFTVYKDRVRLNEDIANLLQKIAGKDGSEVTVHHNIEEGDKLGYVMVNTPVQAENHSEVHNVIVTVTRKNVGLLYKLAKKLLQEYVFHTPLAHMLTLHKLERDPEEPGQHRVHQHPQVRSESSYPYNEEDTNTPFEDIKAYQEDVDQKPSPYSEWI
jgi:hypothetical protein